MKIVGAGIELKVYTSLSEIEKIRRSWKSIVNTCSFPMPFSHPAWCIPWLRSIGVQNNWEPFIIIESNYILPFIRKNRDGINYFFFIGKDLSDYHDLPCLDERIDFDQIITETLKNYRPYNLTLNRIHKNSITSKFLSSRPFAFKNKAPCPFINLNIEFPNNYLQLMRNKRKKYWKNTIRGMLKLREITNYEFKVVSNPKEILDYVNYILYHKEQKYVKTFAPNLNKIPGYLDFIKFATEDLGKNKMLFIVGLESNEFGIIAAQWGLQYRGIIYWYLPVFSPIKDYQRYSPGRILIIEVLFYASKSGYTKLDFTEGNEKYKLILSDNIYENVYSYNQIVKY